MLQRLYCPSYSSSIKLILHSVENLAIWPRIAGAAPREATTPLVHPPGHQSPGAETPAPVPAPTPARRPQVAPAQPPAPALLVALSTKLPPPSRRRRRRRRRPRRRRRKRRSRGHVCPPRGHQPMRHPSQTCHHPDQGHPADSPPWRAQPSGCLAKPRGSRFFFWHKGYHDSGDNHDVTMRTLLYSTVGT